MDLIKTLSDFDFDIIPLIFNNPRIRHGARGIVFNDKNNIAILNKTKKNEFKLIGGGIEKNEDPAIAFQREVLEETGCVVEIDNCLGAIKEEKSQDNFIQISTVYVAHVVKDTKQLKLTSDEIEDGATLLWLPLNIAIEKIRNSEKKLVASSHEGNMSIYHTKFIVRRDYTILKYYIDNILKKEIKK